MIIASVIGIAIIVATVYFAREVPLPRRARTTTRSRSTATPGSRSAGPSCPRSCSRWSRCPRSARSSTWPTQPEADALEVTVVGKQWWWEFEYTDAKVVTADELVIPAGRQVHLKLKACEADTCNVIHSFWVPGARGYTRCRARSDQRAHAERRQTGDLPRAVQGVLRAVARQHALPGDREDRRRLRAVGQRATARSGAAPVRRRGRRRGTGGACPGAHRHQVPVHQLPRLRRLVARHVRPEPHPPREPRLLRRARRSS